VSVDSPRFPPSVADRLQEREGSVVVHTRTDVSALLDERTWRVELSWTADGATISAGAA